MASMGVLASQPEGPRYYRIRGASSGNQKMLIEDVENPFLVPTSL